MTRMLVIAPLALAVACGSSPRVGEPIPGSGELASDLSSLQATIFTPSCASCHSGNVPVYLDAGRSWSSMVGQPSTQAPLNVVEPGDPEASYLVLKLRGTAGSVGGVSTPMPIGAPLLDEAQIRAIETWIANGAPND